MKKLLLLCVLFYFSIAYAAEKPKYLYISTAPKARLIKQAGDKYELIFNQESAKIGYFTDRPYRDTGILDFKQFINLWTTTKVNNNFSKVPPNVAVAMILSNGKKQGFVAEMGMPFTRGNKIIYRLLKISKKPITEGVSQVAVVFIDDIQWNPSGF